MNKKPFIFYFVVLFIQAVYFSCASVNKPIANSDSQYKGRVSKVIGNSFSADAFFSFTGEGNYSNNQEYIWWIKISKSGFESYSYYAQGNFKKNIWLRYGAGEYQVVVYRPSYIEADLNGKGWIRKYGSAKEVWQFTVYNVRNEDGRFLYPSEQIQSDSEIIKNLAQALTKDFITERAKIKAIHDYVAKYLTYDHDSLEPGMRKKMDALSALQNKTAVCEGYTNLTIALLRAAGFHTKYVSGKITDETRTNAAHAWLEVFTEGKWKIIDTTWDDPILPIDDPNYVRYDYFLLDTLPKTHFKDDKISIE